MRHVMNLLPWELPCRWPRLCILHVPSCSRWTALLRQASSCVARQQRVAVLATKSVAEPGFVCVARQQRVASSVLADARQQRTMNLLFTRGSKSKCVVEGMEELWRAKGQYTNRLRRWAAKSAGGDRRDTLGSVLHLLPVYNLFEKRI